MLDPQAIQLIVLLVVVGFVLIFVLGLIYGLVLLAKIRSQAVRINKSLDELLARSAANPTTASGPKSSQ
ncbi:MAG: hypothetical protein P8Z30_03720 [Acidobacteriota bacterium]